MPYIEGVAREQAALLPVRVDDYVERNDLVRFIAGFVESLPMSELGFERTVAAETGRPGYDPRQMLGLWIYGYVNGLTSSRKLERETHRNVEVMWLLRMLRPDFKTIADFRKDHKAAMGGVFGAFTKMLRAEGLISGELVSIDGSKFRAVNSTDRNYTEAKLNRLQKQIDERIEKFLREAGENDEKESAAEEGPKGITPERREEILSRLRQKKDEYTELAGQMRKSGEAQISLTDPESRRMKMRNGMNICYNAQTAVDGQHKLIVVMDVTNEPTDQNQLSAVAIKAKEVLEVETLTVVADKGYSNSVELAKCEQAGITTYVPQPAWRRNDKRGLYSKEDFTYQSESDTYRCPAGQELTYRFKSSDKNRMVHYYMTDACGACLLRNQCMGPNQKKRRIGRRADEQEITAAARRARERPDLMAKRKELSEHPFGSIKRWINGGYFLLKGLAGVQAEAHLAALAYNIKRFMNIQTAVRAAGLA
jgi:transposase